jgi:PST family polysaccharide transporter
MGPALVRRAVVTAEHIDVAFLCMMTLALLTGTVIMLAAAPIARFFDSPVLRSLCWAVAALVPIHAATSIASALLSRRSAFRFMALAALPGLILGYAGTSILLAAHGFGAWSIMVGSLVQYGLTGAILLVRARYVPTLRWSAAAFKDLMVFSLWQSLSQLINQVALSGDNFIVGRALGMAPLGLYGRAYKLMEIPVNTISTTLFKVSFPLMSAMQAQRERLAEVYLASLCCLLTVLIPLSVLLVFAGRPLVLVIIGSKWEGAIVPFQILCVSLTFRAAYRHINLPTLIIGGAADVTLLNALYAGWVLIGSLIAVISVGTIAAVAFAVSLAILIHYLTSAWSANRLLQITAIEFARLHFPGILIGSTLAAGLYLAQAVAWLVRGSGLALAVDVALPTVVVTLCLYLWPRLFLGTRNLSLLTRITHSMPIGRRPIQTWLASANGRCAGQQHTSL